MRDITLLSQTKPYLPSPPPMHHHRLLLLLLLHSLPFPPPPPTRTTPNQIAAIRSQSSHSSSFTHYQINDKFHRKKKHNQNLNPKKERCKSAITMATRECEIKKSRENFSKISSHCSSSVLFEDSFLSLSLSLCVCLSLNLCLGEREKCREKMREREGKNCSESEWVSWVISERKRERERESELVFDESDWWIKSKRQLKPK